MKKLYLFIVIISLQLFFNNAFSQDGPNVWTLTYNNQGRIYAMVIDPVNQNIIYEAGLDSGIYKTTNAGLNWFPVNNGLTYNKVQCLSISLSNPLILYAGTDQNGAANSGIYKTTNGGSNWTLISNGITDSKGIQSIAIHPTNPNTAWAAVFDGVVPSTVGVFKTTDGGANWFTSSTGIDIKNILTVIVNPLNGNCLYAGSSFYTAAPGSTKIYKSFDGGSNWTSFSSGLPSGAATGNPVRNMSMSTIDTSVVLATLFCNDTTGGAYLTTNAGVNWDSTGMYLPQAGSETGYNNSFVMAQNRVWFGTNNSRIYYSTNNGTNWIVQSTTPEASVYSIWFDQGGSANGFFGGANVYKTTDYGTAWTSIGSIGTGNIAGLAGLPMWSGNLWYVKSGNSNIYFGYGVGSWVSQYTAPAGTYRHITTERIPNYPFNGYAVRTNGGISHRSIFVEGINKIGNEIPEEFSLGQNYPNPFNPETKIRFNIPPVGAQYIEPLQLIVYDILGREVTTLVNEQLSPGAYEVTWDASNYPSGTYFYKIFTENYSKTLKMVLIK